MGSTWFPPFFFGGGPVKRGLPRSGLTPAMFLGPIEPPRHRSGNSAQSVGVGRAGRTWNAVDGVAKSASRSLQKWVREFSSEKIKREQWMLRNPEIAPPFRNPVIRFPKVNCQQTIVQPWLKSGARWISSIQSMTCLIWPGLLT